MSFRRKEHDGDVFGRGAGNSERRDPFGSENQAYKSAPSKRTAKNDRLRNGTEESAFSEEGDKDRYLITYSDLITLLLGLFIILYAVSSVDMEKYQKMMNLMGNVFGKEKGGVVGVNYKIPDARGKIGITADLKDDLQDLIEKNNLTNGVRLEENERGITIHILDDILFPSATADLNENSTSVLGKIASVIRSLPNDIRIEGHTDDVPIETRAYPSNWHLSVARALNTAYYLINSEGLSPAKVSIVGYSEYRPVASNASAEGKQANRRVDIVILRSKNQL